MPSAHDRPGHHQQGERGHEDEGRQHAQRRPEEQDAGVEPRFERHQVMRRARRFRSWCRPRCRRFSPGDGRPQERADAADGGQPGQGPRAPRWLCDVAVQVPGRAPLPAGTAAAAAAVEEQQARPSRQRARPWAGTGTSEHHGHGPQVPPLAARAAGRRPAAAGSGIPRRAPAAPGRPETWRRTPSPRAPCGARPGAGKAVDHQRAAAGRRPCAMTVSEAARAHARAARRDPAQHGKQRVEGPGVFLDVAGAVRRQHRRVAVLR